MITGPPPKFHELRDILASTPLIRAHTELGDYLLPWAIALAAVALALATRQLLATRARLPCGVLRSGGGVPPSGVAVARFGAHGITLLLHCDPFPRGRCGAGGGARSAPQRRQLSRAASGIALWQTMLR